MARRFLFPCLMLAACSRAEKPREIPPYENLLTVVAEFQQNAGADLYRREMPRDLTGQNLFRAILARLDSFEEANPGRDTDIAQFVRGGAYARLEGFAPAAEAFEKVRSDSPLAAEAASWSRICRALEAASRRAPQADRMQEYLNDLESRRSRLAALEEEFEAQTVAAEMPQMKKQPERSRVAAMLARREKEQTDVEYTLFLFRNRYVLERGAARALEAARRMLEDHAESIRFQAHRLRLGRFYLQLARDMADLTPPEGLEFDAARCLEFAAAAREQFVLVSRADGFEEKPEGAALLREIDAFARRIQRLAR